ncbi:MAG: rhomboid family intramembrane serine protease [Halobacteria archaeon]|nr:rhomboid family intramembrane serine protease [Halobacteria archaeon]
MVSCDECGEEIGAAMPYDCRLCGGTYCSEHRLPENHSCSGLSSYEDSIREEGTRPHNKSMNTTRASTSGARGRISSTLRGFRGNVTYLLLAVMVVVFLLQRFLLLGDYYRLHRALFVLTPAHPEYVWTWVTSIFAHANMGHIFVNGLVLYFFGTVLEKRIGSKRFLGLFMLTGIFAGLAQTVVTLVMAGPSAPGVLGASGAIMAVMGSLTVLNPNLRVYLWFIIPIPLWVLTLGFAALDFFALSAGGAGAGGVARLAHLSGLLLGVAYGWKLKQEGVSMGQRLELGSGGGGRRPPRL